VASEETGEDAAPNKTLLKRRKKAEDTMVGVVAETSPSTGEMTPDGT